MAQLQSHVDRLPKKERCLALLFFLLLLPSSFQAQLIALATQLEQQPTKHRVKRASAKQNKSKRKKKGGGERHKQAQKHDMDNKKGPVDGEQGPRLATV